MSASTYAAKLSANELTQLIVTLRAEAPFAILERQDKVDFPGPSEAIEPNEWPVGWIFGKQIELHWERDDTAYQVRLTSTGEVNPPPGFKAVLMLNGPEPYPIWYYLWGEDETAIGGRLNYSRAIPGQGRGQLGVVEYRNEENQLLFYRYFGLKREENHD